jgi:SPP1 family predicted phage head-tail adaptor
VKPIQSGKLRQRVTLQDLVETLDSYGQPIQGWADVATFSAEVRPLRGVEVLNIKQVWATASHFVNHRYLGPDIKPNPKQRYKLLKDQRIFNILNVNNVEERNRSYEVTCEEYVQ